jgi:hypothetical protein
MLDYLLECLPSDVVRRSASLRKRFGVALPSGPDRVSVLGYRESPSGWRVAANIEGVRREPTGADDGRPSSTWTDLERFQHSAGLIAAELVDGAVE